MIHELAAQQRQFAAAVVGDGATTTLLTRRATGAGARVDVYRHAYRARLTEALRGNYAVLHRVLGDEAFGELAKAYLQARPSIRPSIRWFGDDLVDFMRSSAVPHPSLIDLARMEWSLSVSFDSADATVLTPADLMAIAPTLWPSLRFEAHPSVALLWLDWSVEPVWRTLTDDEHAQADAPEPSSHPLLVWRQQLETRWRSLPDNEAALLQNCLRGQDFAQLCEQAVAFAGDDAAAFAAGALRRWVEDGLLTRLRPPTSQAT